MTIDPCQDEGIYIVPPSEPGCTCEDLLEAIDSKQDKLVAGANIIIDPETNVISAIGGGGGGGLSCDDLQYCEIIRNMETAIADKQDKLTAGDHISIAQDGTISGTYTKSDILTLLGYSEIPIRLTDASGQTVSITLLGVRNNE